MWYCRLIAAPRTHSRRLNLGRRTHIFKAMPVATTVVLAAQSAARPAPAAPPSATPTNHLHRHHHQELPTLHNSIARIVAWFVAQLSRLLFVMIVDANTKSCNTINAGGGTIEQQLRIQRQRQINDKSTTFGIAAALESCDSLPLVPVGRRGSDRLEENGFAVVKRRSSRLSLKQAATPIDKVVKWYRRATGSASNMPMLSPQSSPGRRPPTSPRRAPSSSSHFRSPSGQMRPSSSHARLEAQSEMLKLKEEIQSSAYEIRDLEQLSERVKKRSPSIRILTARALPPTASSSGTSASSRITEVSDTNVLVPLSNVNSPRTQSAQTGKRLNSLMQEKDAMHRSIVELRTKLEEERREKVALRVKKSSLEEALQHQRLANDIQATSLDRKDRTIADLRDRVAQMEAQMLTNRRDKDTMDVQLEEARRRELKLKEEIEEDHMKMAQVEGAHEQLVHAYSTLKQITKSQVETARQEAEMLRVQVDSHQAGNEERIQRINDLEAAHKKEMAQLTTSLERCRAALYEQRLEQERLLARLSQETDAAVSQTAHHTETVAMLQQQMRECLPYIQRAALGIGATRPPAHSNSNHVSA